MRTLANFVRVLVLSIPTLAALLLYLLFYWALYGPEQVVVMSNAIKEARS